MEQRLQFTIVLLTKSGLIFLDELTGGLDISVQAKLLYLLPT
ncbi:phosphonate C-P lyase system protein PhnK [Chondrocystis sp. NIES-4102]|nr:phosphonate C-P lyase system protein PhnK [Chondrocystis sp. NIES-4102]